MQLEIHNTSYLSTTFDIWQSISEESFLGVTIHFIKNFTLQSRLLALKYIDSDHSATSIYNELDNLFQRIKFVIKYVKSFELEYNFT